LLESVYLKQPLTAFGQRTDFAMLPLADRVATGRQDGSDRKLFFNRHAGPTPYLAPGNLIAVCRTETGSPIGFK
jgi:hypothetical protein